MTFAQKILDFHVKTLQPNWKLPKGVNLLYPFGGEDTQACMKVFYEKYFSDNRDRIFVAGINPGRFGAGRGTGPTRVRLSRPWRTDPTHSPKLPTTS